RFFAGGDRSIRGYKYKSISPEGSDGKLKGASKLATGSLEQSSVDLSQEFSDMITTQRAYQANSRLITVSDTMLEELVNLKR
ncbi:MAG: flagellar basal body rod C-terminal domain-containing protein, partial [Angelakisella sp.]